MWYLSLPVGFVSWLVFLLRVERRCECREECDKEDEMTFEVLIRCRLNPKE